MLSILGKAMRAGVTAACIASLGACQNMGQLGNVLGGVLVPQNQVSGTVQSVDTRMQQIWVQQPNGQSLGVSYSNQTQVVYQNQNYPVTSLEPGDQITVRLQDNGNGSYTTDYVQVDQPVNGSPTSSVPNNGAVQTVQGTVQQVDRSNGWFSLNLNGSVVTVTMPYNPSQQDMNRFQSLRSGDYVRLYGVFLNNSRVELRQFY